MAISAYKDPEYHKKYYQAHKAEFQARQKRLTAEGYYRENYRKNRNRRIMQSIASYQKHKDARKLQRAKYLAENDVEIKAKASAWRKQNRVALSARNLEWLRVNPERGKHYDRLKYARRKNVEGRYTKAEWDELKQLFGYYCPKCLRQEPDIKLTVDHKIPVTKNGTNYLDNIQPLCQSCNSAKYDKVWFASWPLAFKQVFKINNYQRL